MCNGTRLIVRRLQRNFITAEIISQCNRGEIVFIPRIDLAPSDTMLPFVLRRRQFPIIPAYSITINKAQGQTFEYVGIHLSTAVFAHGQLYVALSRSKNPNQIKVKVSNNALQGRLSDNRVYTKKNLSYDSRYHYELIFLHSSSQYSLMKMLYIFCFFELLGHIGH